MDILLKQCFALEHQGLVNATSSLPHSRSLQGKLTLLHLYIALAGIQVSATVMGVIEVTIDVQQTQHDASCTMHIGKHVCAAAWSSLTQASG